MSRHTLTDTQLMLLSSASQREDLLITLPETLKGGAVKAVTSKLLAYGLVEQVPVGLMQPALHRGDDGQATGLKLTSAGLQAIGLEPDGDAPDDQPSSESQDRREQPPSDTAPAQDGAKRARVVELLSREEGATINELTAATGWLPHSARAALTGLRQRGYALTREAGEKGRVYRITSAPGSAQRSATAPAAVEG